MFLTKFIQHNSRLLLTTARQIYYQLLPSTCILCGYQSHQPYNICQKCWQDLPILTHYCLQCAQYLPLAENQTLLCGTCLKKPPPFKRTYALFPYQPPIIQMIIRLKFQQQLSYANAFSDFFITQIQQQWYVNKPLPDIIIPMPLHAARLRERGFNQALEISRPIAKTLGIALDIHGVKRTKYTAAQSGLSARKRKQNMANAFTVYRNYSGLSIAVLDDVVTTGHTIAALCRALVKNGADPEQIDVWCSARR